MEIQQIIAIIAVAFVLLLGIFYLMSAIPPS